ncbi:MAG: T9SS type A sorting domain-containing protein [Saprospiraceae bacterium]|nr:T9SS type A sorting domain-containing protein [Saprospiraceae bacterium]
MKHLIPLFLLLISTVLHAQNWMPVVSGDVYHFRAEDSSFITHTIRVDSVKKVGEDSVFYLNRIVLVDYLSPDFVIVSSQKGQFLGQQMTKKPNGSLVFASELYDESRSVIIFPNAPINASWMAFDDVSATVISAESGVIFGEADSLKNIFFSNGLTWILSKNHGVIHFENLFYPDSKVELSGIETRNVGDRLLGFSDFFSFHVGDTFEWRYSYSGVGGSNSTISKWHILDKEVFQDSFRYYVARKRKSVSTAPNLNTYFTHDTLWVEINRSQFKNSDSYNNQGVVLDNYFYEETTYVTCFEGGKKVGHKPAIPNTQFICSIFPVGLFQEAYFPSQDGLSRCCNIADPDFSCESRYFYEEYREGLGRVDWGLSVIDNQLSDQLLGAVIQGDTVWGAISPDWFFTSTHTPATPQPLLVMPNPAEDFIYLNMANPEGEVAVKITDVSGKTCVQQTLKLAPGSRLDISVLPPGVFLIQVIGTRQMWGGKFQKLP